MRTITHSVDIPAPAATVWRVLTEIDRYDEWNPFMTGLSGRLVVGERLTVTIRPGARSLTFRPTVVAVEAGVLVRWRGSAWIPETFDSEHELCLEPGPEDSTRFAQREVFTGKLVPALRRVIDDTESGFAAMNTALRERAISSATGLPRAGRP
jgi:hypothetical protein